MNIEIPARHLRENPSHSISWRIFCTAHLRRIIQDLMIQQWNPSLKKQVHSYVRSETLPIGKNLKHIKYACSWSFYPEDDLISQKRLVSFLFLTFWPCKRVF